MIELVLSDSGQIVLRVVREPRFFSEEHDVELGLFLNAHIGETPSELSLGTIDRARDIVEYVEAWAKKAGFELEYGETLAPLANAVKGEASLVEEIATAKAPSLIADSTTLVPNRVLLPHQVKALSHALRVRNPANFSVPGSGKTSVALAAYAFWKARQEVSLLVVIGPASCFDPWEEEFEACFGRPPKVIRLTSGLTDRRRALAMVRGVDLILTTYQMAYRSEEPLRNLLSRVRVLLVLDESHNVKRYQAGAWAEAVLRLSPSASHRMILTGTPAPHSPLDFWTQFTFLWPSAALLGSRTDFERDYRGPVTERLRDRIQPFYHRTSKSELGLPEPSSETVLINPDSWPPIQRRIVRLLEIKTLRDLQQLPLKPKDEITLRHWRRSRIIRLLEAASNPALLGGRDPSVSDDDYLSLDTDELADLVANYNDVERAAKVEWTVSKARELVDEGHKVVIWTWFVGNIRLLEQVLSDLGVVTAYGAIKPFETEDDEAGDASRERNIRRFKTEAEIRILLANPAACAESISLHHACHDAIYLDRTFNCGQFLQSLDRIHRVGLPPGTIVHYYMPVLNCSIDRLVDRRLVSRQRLLYDLLMDKTLPIGGWTEDLVVDDDDELDGIMAELRGELSGAQNG